MPNYTKDQQQAIAEIAHNLQIIACAGSGKTQVISARVVEILRERKAAGIGPGNIVAFTFTDKAAAELKDRISRLVTEALGDVPGMAEMYVGTIHGYCLQLLQTYLFEYLKYSVLTDVQNRLLVSRNSVKSGLKEVEIISGPSAGQKLKRGPQDVRIFIEALNVIREDNPKYAELPPGLISALDRYNALLDQHRYLDYSRILVDALVALHDPDDPNRLALQEELRSRVKYLIVDEYQDVNPLQEGLIWRLHELGANLCVVGDDDQAIYQWRGSEIRNILEFKNRYPSVCNVTIAENFRSSRGVVDTAKQIAQINTNRLPKAMVAGGHQPFLRGDLLGLTFASPEEEANWIATRILELQGVPFVDEPSVAPRGLSWADCAILLRSVRKSGEVITATLKHAGVPYVVGGLSNLFDSAEVQASVALFRYVAGEIAVAELLGAWRAADLGLDDADLARGVAVLDRAKTWEEGERWSSYNLQRTFLDFLEAVALREERVPPTKTGAARGEIAYLNLGKFSQAISDFEQIYFQTQPQEKYTSFVWWLANEAPDIYEEGGEDVGFSKPNAVQIMTVHQAKGMEWPAVFVPALQRNRFPSASGARGRSKWHILPPAAVPDAARYDGSIEDERRLFYVALTRSKKYLYCTYAPAGAKGHYSRPSAFQGEFIASTQVLTRAVPIPPGGKLTPRPRRETPNVALSFSELKYFFECPYQFKLRFVYGFNPPLHEALGFGKSIHDALAEVHKRAKAGDIMTEGDAEVLIDNHLHAPFAYPALKEQLRAAAIASVKRYLRAHGASLQQTLHSEQQVELQVVPGITVNGRIDLIKRLDTGETAIVDFKSSERAQAEDVTRAQLHTYAMGYRQLTGRDADLVEILNLDEAGKSVREVVDDTMLRSTETEIRRAGESIRTNSMGRLAAWCGTCAACDLAGICRKRDSESPQRSPRPRGKG
jgi:DNA helicase-2/ATP-dependent DNA helicase PcrA